MANSGSTAYGSARDVSRVPAVGLAPVDGGSPVELRGGRGPRVLLLPQSPLTDPDVHYVGALASAVGSLTDWGARLIVALAAPADDAASTRPLLPDPAALLADDDGVVRTAFGVRGTGLVIADEWGEVHFFADTGSGDDLPPADEVVEWAKFISIQCPECEQSEGGWRDI